MKKTLSVILVAVMLLSTLVSLVVPAAAAEESASTGAWKVSLTASAYGKEANTEKNPPLPGWKYDETGFHTISPNYENFNPKFTVVSNEQYDIKNFSMKVKVHDYSFEGDTWLSFSVWSESNGISQGDTSGDYGYGWTSLIRSSTVPVGEETKNALTTFQSWDMGATRKGGTLFKNIENVQFDNAVIPDENNDMTFEFAIVEGQLKVNGQVIGTATDDAIAKSFSQGLAYVAVTIHNSDASGKFSPTISILEVNGQVPTGSADDTAEPENKQRTFGDPIDPSNVPLGQPAIWFGADPESTTNAGKKPSGSVCDVSYSDNNDTFKVTVNGTAHTFQFDVPDEITHNAENYTYIAYIFKNLCTCTREEGDTIHDCGEGEVMGIRFCAGEVTAPNDVCSQSVGWVIHITSEESKTDDGNYDEYTLALIKVTNDMWKGRIHNIRIDIAGYNNYNVEGENTYEIVGAGIFRNGNDMHDFVANYGNYNWDTEYLDLQLSMLDEEFTGGNDGDGTTNPGDDGETTTVEETTVAEETTTVAPEQTTAAPEQTTAAPADEKKSGCGSVVSLGAIAIVTVACGAGFVARKKKED